MKSGSGKCCGCFIRVSHNSENVIKFRLRVCHNWSSWVSHQRRGNARVASSKEHEPRSYPDSPFSPSRRQNASMQADSRVRCMPRVQTRRARRTSISIFDFDTRSPKGESTSTTTHEYRKRFSIAHRKRKNFMNKILYEIPFFVQY